MSPIKRMLISLTIMTICTAGAVRLVGGDIIPAGAGLAVLLIGVALALAAFVYTEPKA